MRKSSAILGSAIFLVLAPGFVAGLVPWWISHWRMRSPFFGLVGFRYAGAVILLIGAGILLDSFGRFALQGLGTPAPIFPTRHLVISGLYRYVRNPMYVAVVATIAGQGFLFGNAALLEYAAMVWLLMHLFVLVYEEPTLRSTYGAVYEQFCAEVPRWIPRVAVSPPPPAPVR